MANERRIPQKISDFDQYIQNTGTYLAANGNGTRLGRVVSDLQANEELFERPYAMKVVRRFAH